MNGSELATRAIRCPALQVFGEITSRANVDYDAVARQVCHDIGYNSDVSRLWSAVTVFGWGGALCWAWRDAVPVCAVS